MIDATANLVRVNIGIGILVDQTYGGPQVVLEAPAVLAEIVKQAEGLASCIELNGVFGSAAGPIQLRHIAACKLPYRPEMLLQ